MSLQSKSCLDWTRVPEAADSRCGPGNSRSRDDGDAGCGEIRSEGRLDYPSGCYSRSLITWVRKIELKVPQDRQGRFSTELFESTSARTRRWCWGPGGNGRARRLDAEGEAGHRGAGWLLGLGDQRDQQAAGCVAEGVLRAQAQGTVPLSDPGCAL
ncbi:transposase [Bradyrhizobium sp. 153]|nr:transposase [Bradyrhizobium sp. 153]